MPSGYSGRYQSRLFNFIHQQSRRLTEQWEHTFRQVQVGTRWGVEVIFYPMYLLFHSVQSVGKQLYTKEPQTRLELEPETPPTADTPIQHVLEDVKNLPPQETSVRLNPLTFFGSLWSKIFPQHPSTPILVNPDDDALKVHHPVVRGIATNLLNRNLVLVNADNEILDILTLQQQKILEDKIIREIGKYWGDLQFFSNKKETEILPEINRLLAKLTGEKPQNIATIASETITSEEFASQYLLKSNRALGFLDAVVANLEFKALVPLKQHSQKIIRVAQTQLDIFIYGKEQLAARGQIAVNNNALETQDMNFQALIAAAINYFFGDGTNKKLQSKAPDIKSQDKRLPYHPYQTLPSSNQLEKDDLTAADTWLSFNDLFADAETQTDKPIRPSLTENYTQVSSPLVTHPAPKDLIVKPSKSKSGLVQQKKPRRHLTSTHKKSAKVVSSKVTTSSISQSQSKHHKEEISQKISQNPQFEATSDWIETKATSMGYEKHILEQILEWLDSAMLWLEAKIVKIFQFVHQIWRGK
ncbi:MAG: hypothetical protein KA716_18965 [Gloeotrichia echinulata DEX184]|nr:hypothetical protein [Gloeotrichia echinulata DEX184]